MNQKEFLNYVEANVNLGAESAKTLVNNIIGYVVGQGLVDENEEHDMLACLLDGIGIDEEVIYATHF